MGQQPSSSFFVEGPIAVSIYSIPQSSLPTQESDPIHVWIFGEYHRFLGPCDAPRRANVMSLPAFIHEYCRKEVDSTVDLFLETEYPWEKERTIDVDWALPLLSWKDERGLLSGMTRYFVPCSPKYKDDQNWGWKQWWYRCPRNLRVHLCDIRQTEWTFHNDRDKRQMIFFELLTFLSFSKNDPGLYLFTRSSWGLIVDFLDIFLYDERSDYHYTQMNLFVRNNYKITKQLQKINFQGARMMINRYYNELMTETMKEMKCALDKFKQSRFIQEILSKRDRVQEEEEWMEPDNEATILFQDVQRNILYYRACFMDLYLLGRVFAILYPKPRRQFDSSSTFEPPLRKKRIIMIDVGEAHAFHYRKLFTSLFCLPIYQYPSSARTQESLLTSFTHTSIHPSIVRGESCVQVDLSCFDKR